MIAQQRHEKYYVTEYSQSIRGIHKKNYHFFKSSLQNEQIRSKKYINTNPATSAVVKCERKSRLIRLETFSNILIQFFTGIYQVFSAVYPGSEAYG